MQNVCVAATGDSRSQWEKAFGRRVQQSGHAAEWKELHATLGILERTQKDAGHFI